MSFNCLECEQEFDSERSLHAHIKKHEIYLHDYFVKHFSRRNLLTNELLPFKNKESYFDYDFDNIDQLYKWCSMGNPQTVKNYILDKLATRIKSRNLNFAPNEIELYTSMLPSISIYKNSLKVIRLHVKKLAQSQCLMQKFQMHFGKMIQLKN